MLFPFKERVVWLNCQNRFPLKSVTSPPDLTVLFLFEYRGPSVVSDRIFMRCGVPVRRKTYNGVWAEGGAPF